MDRLLKNIFPSYGGVNNQYSPLSNEEDGGLPQEVSVEGHSMKQVDSHPKN